MKGKKLGVLLAALAAVIVLVVVAVFAMGGNNKPNKDTEKEPNKNTEQSTEDTDELQPVVLTDKALEGDFLMDFANGPNSAVVFESDGWSNGSVFNVVWTKNNVRYADGKMYLGITKENKTAWLDNKEVAFEYTAGEARTQNYFGYGDYFVKMKPSANPGTASTFFTCTGNYDSKYVLDENGAVMLNEDGTIKMEQNPHDEIDIEFLGKDTTKVQFNFFVNGVGGNEYMYDLGFDASKEFHEYGFRWEEDSITWFIDGKPVYKVTTDNTVEPAANVRIVDALPKTAGRLLMNYWCGNEEAEGWMGKYEGNVNDNGCEYQWIKTSTKGAPLNPENVDLSAAENCLIVNGTNYLFTTDAGYEFKALNDNKALNVTYKNIVGATYGNIATGLTDLPSKYNKLSMKVKNNGKEAVKIRIDVQSQTQVSKNTKACNVYATQDGNEVFTDTDWGGSQFTIEAGKTSTLEVYFDPAMKTEALIIYIDSADYLEDGKNIKHSGNVTFSNVTFSTGKVPVAQAPTPVVPDTDTSELDRVEADLTFESNDIYTVTKDDENKTWNVTYTNVKGGGTGEGYKVIKSAVEELDPGLNRYSVTVKNNGTKAVKVRIDIIGKTEMGKLPDDNPLMACNLGALQDGKEASTDLQWGGSTFTIEPGKTSVLEVVFKAEQVVDRVEFFFDSHIYDDNDTHAGDVTLSEMAFLGELEGEVDGPIQTPGYGDDAPEIPVSGNLTTTINGTNFTIAGNTTDGYGVNASVDENNNQIVDIVYTNVIGSSYKNINIGGIGELAAAHDTFKVEITNNGTETVKIRIDLQDAAGKICNTSATETAVHATTDANNGTQIELAAGATAIVEIKYDATKNPTALYFFIDSWKWDDSTPHAGDITLSGMEFKTVEDEGEEDDDQDDPVTPPAVTYDKLTFWTTAGYTVDTTEATDIVNIKYNGAGNTYGPAGASVADLANGKDTFSFKVKNNGTEDIAVRVDIQGTTKVGNTDAVNVSATANGQEVYTDTTWGGSKIDVAAGATVEVVVTYDANTERGAVTNVMFYTGSQLGTADTVTSDVTISEFLFSKVAVDEEDDPVTPPTVTYDKLTFWGNAGYTLDTSAATDIVNIKYNGAGNTYAPAGASVADLANGKDTFSFKITNNGTETATVRVDIQGTTKVGNTDAVNVSATANGQEVYTDTTWGGSKIEVAAGTTVEVVVTYDGNTERGAVTNVMFYTGSQLGSADTVTSDITIKDFLFSKAE